MAHVLSPSAEPLVLIPGLLCDADLWQYQVSALGDIMTPIIPDLTEDDTIAGMARRILAAAPDRFALAGLSMGGYVAQEIMRTAPERVTRFALIDTSARADSPETRARRHGLIRLAGMGRFQGVTERLLPLLIHERHLGGPIAATVMAMAKRIGRDAYIRQQTAILGRIDGRDALARIRVPSIVICGADDAITPPDHAQEMAALIPDADLHLIPDCGHLAPLEEPAQTNRILRDWLVE